MLRKTKIVCTIGPATDSEEMIGKLFDSGMNVSRHNFSHGNHDSHRVTMERVRKVAGEKHLNYAILLDTKGPEIRARDFKNGKVILQEGTEVTVVGGEDFLGDETRFAVTYKDLAKVMEPGKHILLNDGLVDLEVTAIFGNEVKTIVRNTGEISNRKSSNLPGVKTNLPALTEQDKKDLAFGAEFGVDIIAASFIRKGSDVLEIRKVLHELNASHIHIYSKIENEEGVENVDEIIKYSDGIMVARGDMGVEIPIERVPMIQKMIIEKCNAAGKPVITATQMLDSMVRNPRPTRAEVSDVANAIMDGSDAVMLSGETASGEWPVEAVQTMTDIALATESQINYNNLLTQLLKNQTNTVQSAISAAVCTTANKLETKAIITGTTSGSTARNIAKFRPKSTIIAVTPVEAVARKLACTWGVYPIVSETFESTDELIEKTTAAAKAQGFVQDGDLVVISAGIPVNFKGSTNMMKIHIIGDVLLEGKGLEPIKRQVSGIATIVHSPLEAENRVEAGSILVVHDLIPDYLPHLHEAEGVVVEAESISPEVTIEVLKMEIPIVYAAREATHRLKDGTMITVDGKVGIVTSGKSSAHS
ncbi:pyruvate kinase [Clostridiaceae bacterium HFYG-1003]|nr:pyruvate kinase [Clostridiaceae bacterium HFYG-1003]